ncbi:PREDICTED: uncharacterized protein LOC104788735 [Camelina sativa]|uniref:Uncharacterized protein LOC104788735 n=1 Tax=Camelina sativa TaxID=90675 RepID=A0ABM0ZAN9_CAMSA|nr:PREDICTED: uncharacterized protein LOC104788735 [Camelina sativa]
MAEPNQILRKRMRFSSPSATEILATKKSLHHQRIASQTVNRSRVHHPSPSLSGKIDRTYPRVTIKDLRLRRVFSPSPNSTDDCEFNGKGRNRNKEEQYHICRCNCPDSNNGIKAHACGLGNVEAEELLQTTSAGSELVNEEVNVAASVKRSVNTNLGSNKSVLHPSSIAKIFKNPRSLSYKRLLPYLMQAVDDGTSSSRCSKPLSQNLPDISLSCNREAGETGEVIEEEVSELMTPKCQLPETTKPVSQSVDTVLVKDSAGSLSRNASPLKRVIASSPNKKAACSRRKLFKTPGSVNYRRMLPYLRDSQEDNSCVPETVDHPDQQKNTEESTPLSTISENEGIQEMATSNAAGESDTSSNENEESIPCEHVSVSPEQSDLDKEQETQVKHVIPDTEKNSETPLGSEIPLSSPLVGSRSSSEVASSALPKTFVNNLVGGENMNGAGETEAKISADQLTAELLDSSAVLATPPSISPSKGILRRSMRGCRGSCSCLNCSSFRLNAERAFEFSRNQLQDTEVMVLDLVGEISRLRDLLEKSADQNESFKSQAGEASKRAGEAAELAQSRLHQMNDDLQVHCRIPNEQRARVNFAHYIHEKTIVKASQPNNVITRSP